MAGAHLFSRRRATTVVQRPVTPVAVTPELLALLAPYSRIMIGGAPRAGKTTLAAGLEREVFHTDDLIELGWSEASERVACWTMRDGPWVIEGVAVARAIRKALRMSSSAPCDLLIWLEQPVVQWGNGHAGMAAAGDNVLAEVQAELVGRGARVVRPSDLQR